MLGVNIFLELACKRNVSVENLYPAASIVC